MSKTKLRSSAFSNVWRTSAWIVFCVLLFIEAIINYKASGHKFLEVIWQQSLVLILGLILYFSWKKTKVPRPAELSIALVLAAINEEITSILTGPFYYIGNFFSGLFGFMGGISFIGGYALETVLILVLLLKWATKGNWKEVFILTLKVVALAIVVMTVFFLVVWTKISPIQFN